MSLNFAKDITRRIWDTVLMPETGISRVKEISCKKQNKFIFTDRSVNTIGDINTTGVDKDAADSKKNQAPQDPPHKSQTTEYAEEESLIQDPKNDL